MAVVLKLSEAFGGHRFGPFSSGAVHFGTDRGRCQIVLDASTGLAPCHAVFTIGPGLQFSIAPIDRSCAVYVIRSGTTRANQVMGATALGPNDSFTLGSISGRVFLLNPNKAHRWDNRVHPTRGIPANPVMRLHSPRSPTTDGNSVAYEVPHVSHCP